MRDERRDESNKSRVWFATGSNVNAMVNWRMEEKKKSVEEKDNKMIKTYIHPELLFEVTQEMTKINME